MANLFGDKYAFVEAQRDTLRGWLGISDDTRLVRVYNWVCKVFCRLSTEDHATT
jgi:hypothetical protein